MKRLRAFDPLTFLDVTQTPAIRPEGGEMPVARQLQIIAPTKWRTGGVSGRIAASQGLSSPGHWGSFTTPWGEDDRRDAGTPLACA